MPKWPQGLAVLLLTLAAVGVWGCSAAEPLPTQLEQLQAAMAPIIYEQEGDVTIMRRGDATLTVEALDDGQSFRLTPEIAGVTSENLIVTVTGYDEAGDIQRSTSGREEVNFEGASSAIFQLEPEAAAEPLRYLAFNVYYNVVYDEALWEIPLNGEGEMYTIGGHQMQLEGVKRSKGGYTIVMKPIPDERGLSLFSMNIEDILEDDAWMQYANSSEKETRIKLKTDRKRDETVSLQLSSYNLYSPSWLYPLPASE